jgi:hypothetical protein
MFLNCCPIFSFFNKKSVPQVMVSSTPPATEKSTDGVRIIVDEKAKKESKS